MFWGCMSAEGIGYGCKIEGKMDADIYISILEEELLGTLEYYRLPKERTIFQQDGASIHTAKRVGNWLDQNGIVVLEWPACSPDLNPIENLWAYLKRKLDAYDRVPEGMLELWECVEKEWNAIPKKVCASLYKGMEKRMQAVIKVKGGHMTY